MVRPTTVSFNTTLVPVVTGALNTAPLLLVRVNVLKGCALPIAATTFTVPLVPAFNVTACAPKASPVSYTHLTLPTTSRV